MSGWRSLLVFVLAALVVLGLHYRYQIMALVHPLVASARPPEKPDVLYTWVDKKGVTHFEQESRGTRVEYDGGRITPLAPVDARQLAAADAAAEAERAQKEEAASGHGSQLIHKTTARLQEGVEKMRETKAAAQGL